MSKPNEMTMEDIFGVPTTATDVDDILQPRRVQPAVAPGPLAVPMSANAWTDGIIQSRPEDIPGYFRCIPIDRDQLKGVLNQSDKIQALVQSNKVEIWQGLEQHIPGWLEKTGKALQEAFALGRTPVLDHLVVHYPDVFRDYMGLIPMTGQPGQLMITDEPIHTNKSVFSVQRWGGSDLVGVADLQELGTIWPELARYTQQAIDEGKIERTPDGGSLNCLKLPDTLTGAQRLILFLDYQNSWKSNRWVCTHVAEIAAYLDGRDAAWTKALNSCSTESVPPGARWVGAWFLERMLRATVGTNLGFQQEEERTSYREWLHHAILERDDLFDRLIPIASPDSGGQKKNGEILGIPGLKDEWTGKMSFLLTDPMTAPGIMGLVRRYCREKRQGGRPLIELLGWVPETDPRAHKNQEPTEQNERAPGLVEAALWHSTGDVLRKLFSTDSGIAMIQHILAGPLGGTLLMTTGQNMGWRDLEILVKKHADRWQDWRDIHGNGMAHWLSYGSNKIYGPRAKANRELAQKFLGQMTEANDQGYTPVDFMPTAHATAVAARMIQKAGRRSKDEKKAAARTKPRAL